MQVQPFYFLRSGNAKQLGNGSLIQLCTDYAQAAGVVSGAHTNFGLAGGIVKVQPAAIRAGNNALGA